MALTETSPEDPEVVARRQARQQQKPRHFSPSPSHRQRDAQKNVPPLTTFTPAMFLEAEEDFTLPPPPRPAQASARVSEALAEAEKHSKAVQRNMWRMVAREKNRLYLEARQRLIDTRPEQRSERLSIVSEEGEEAVIRNVQVPSYLFSNNSGSSSRGPQEGASGDEKQAYAKLQEERARERFRFLKEGDQSRFEVGIITRHHLQVRGPAPERTPPREYVKLRSLDVIQMAMQNLESYAEQLPRVLQVRRTQSALETGKSLAARPENSAAGEEGDRPGEDAGGGGDPMDIDNE